MSRDGKEALRGRHWVSFTSRAAGPLSGDVVIMASEDEGIGREVDPLASDLMGHAPSDNGLVLRLVLEQLAKHRKPTILDDPGERVTRRGQQVNAFAAKDFLSCAMTCKRWNTLTEEFLFKPICDSFGWRLPRRPRHQVSRGTDVVGGQWTQLYINHACSFCYELGEFPVRNTGVIRNCSQLFLICLECTKRTKVINHLISKGLRVDLESLHGRRLLDNVKSKKRKRRRR